MISQCKNCGAGVELQFCPYCGQKTDVKRITLVELIKELPHALFHVDRGILYNFLELFKRPGGAIQDFLSGKRKPFFHPVSYLILAGVLNYVVVRLTNLHFYDQNEIISMNAAEVSAIKEYDAIQWWFLEHTYIYILFAIPASSLFLYGIFSAVKQNFNLAESCVIVLFIMAQSVMIQTIIYLGFGWIRSGPIMRTVEMANMFLLVGYASFVLFKLISPEKQKTTRWTFSILGGLGLGLVWWVSAFLLFTVCAPVV